MEVLLGIIIGGLLVGYWRDVKFRELVNVKVFKKQPMKPNKDDNNTKKVEQKGGDVS